MKVIGFKYVGPTLIHIKILQYFFEINYFKEVMLITRSTLTHCVQGWNKAETTVFENAA